MGPAAARDGSNGGRRLSEERPMHTIQISGQTGWEDRSYCYGQEAAFEVAEKLAARGYRVRVIGDDGKPLVDLEPENIQRALPANRA